MHVKHINFENFSGYLNNLYYYSGYGGMDWNDMYEVQSAFINEHAWCDTGYNNALDGQGEAITLGNGGFQAHNLYKTFDLVKGTFASAWEGHQPITVNTYTYSQGQGFTLKATDQITLGENAKTISFSNYGSDFDHISAVSFTSGVGKGGNTCSYGQPTYGYILVMDDLNVKWNWGGKEARAPQHINFAHHAMHHDAPHVEASFAPQSHEGHDAHVLAQPGHDPGGSPHVEHFGP